MAAIIICRATQCNKSAWSNGFCRSHYYRFMKYGDPLAGRISPGVSQNWLRAHLDYDGKECLIWPFGTAFGYAMFNWNGNHINVHRIICEHRNGPAPSRKHQTAHNCGNGNRGCVNPSHLRWATPKENQADRIGHGTSNRGTLSKAAKITETDVREIRIASGSLKEIGARYGLNWSTISNIRHRRIWKWLD